MGLAGGIIAHRGSQVYNFPILRDAAVRVGSWVMGSRPVLDTGRALRVNDEWENRDDGVTLPAGGLGHLFTGLLRQLGEVAVIG